MENPVKPFRVENRAAGELELLDNIDIAGIAAVVVIADDVGRLQRPLLRLAPCAASRHSGPDVGAERLIGRDGPGDFKEFLHMRNAFRTVPQSRTPATGRSGSRSRWT